jgi:hypothetical protein
MKVLLAKKDDEVQVFDLTTFAYGTMVTEAQLVEKLSEKLTGEGLECEVVEVHSGRDVVGV